MSLLNHSKSEVKLQLNTSSSAKGGSCVLAADDDDDDGYGCHRSAS